MKLSSALLVSVLLLLVPAALSLAASGSDIRSAVESRYRLTTTDLLGNVGEPGTVLVVRKEGIKGGMPSRLFRPNLVRGGEVTEAGGGNLPLRGDFDGHLKPGDRLYLFGVRTGADFVELKLSTVRQFIFPGSGTRGPVPVQADVRLVYDGGLAAVSVDRVRDDIAALFTAEGVPADQGRGSAKDEPAKEGVERSPATIRLGQTEAEVAAIFGPPDRTVLLGAKKVFLYGNVKVIFVDGKVVDAE